ncbi:unnamed protein product, partial [Choristocarpus tenellus]
EGREREHGGEDEMLGKEVVDLATRQTKGIQKGQECLGKRGMIWSTVFQVAIECSDDGKAWRACPLIEQQDAKKSISWTMNFPPVHCHFLRLTATAKGNDRVSGGSGESGDGGDGGGEGEVATVLGVVVGVNITEEKQQRKD